MCQWGDIDACVSFIGTSKKPMNDNEVNSWYVLLSVSRFFFDKITVGY